MAGIESLVNIQGKKNELFAAKVDSLPDDLTTMTEDEVAATLPEMNKISLLSDTQGAIPSDSSTTDYTNSTIKIASAILETGQKELTNSIGKCGFGESKTNMMNELNRQQSVFMNPSETVLAKTDNTIGNVKDLCKSSFSESMPNCQDINSQLSSFDLTTTTGVEGLYQTVLDGLGNELENLNPNTIGGMDGILNTTNTNLLSDMQAIVTTNPSDFPTLAASIGDFAGSNLSSLPQAVDGQNALFEAILNDAKTKSLGSTPQALMNTALSNLNGNMGNLTESAAVLDKIKYTVDRVLSDSKQLQDMGIISPTITNSLQKLSSLAGGGAMGAVTSIAQSGLLGPGGSAALTATLGGAEGIIAAMQPDGNGVVPAPPDLSPVSGGGQANLAETSTNFEAMTTGATANAEAMAVSGNMGSMPAVESTSSGLTSLSATATQSPTADIMKSIETMSSMNMPVMKGMPDTAVNSMYLMAAIASTYPPTIPHMFDIADIQTGPILLCPMPILAFVAPEHGIMTLPLICMNMGFAPLVIGATCDNKRFRIGNSSITLPFIGTVGMIIVSFLGGPIQQEIGILTLKTNDPASPVFPVQLRGMSIPRSMLMGQVI